MLKLGINTDYKLYENNDELYQQTFLNILDIKDYDDEIVNKKVNALYDLLYNTEYIIEILDYIYNNNIHVYMFFNNIQNDKYRNLFFIFFSYDYLDLFYKSYISFINNESDCFKNLLEKIKNN